MCSCFLDVLIALQQEAEVIFEECVSEVDIKFSNVYLSIKLFNAPCLLHFFVYLIIYLDKILSLLFAGE